MYHVPVFLVRIIHEKGEEVIHMLTVHMLTEIRLDLTLLFLLIAALPVPADMTD